MTYMIIGLGNPDKKYARNRHNSGALAVDFICEHLDKNCTFKDEHKSLVFKSEIAGEKIIFAKPVTFMNLSGSAVLSLANFYKVPLEKIIVIHDEIDFPFGAVKTKISGGAAGHNGLRDIDAKMGKDYRRIRIGVDHPRNIPGMENMSVSDYVLSNFSNDELSALKTEIFPKVLDIVKEIINSAGQSA